MINPALPIMLFVADVILFLIVLFVSLYRERPATHSVYSQTSEMPASFESSYEPEPETKETKSKPKPTRRKARRTRRKARRTGKPLRVIGRREDSGGANTHYKLSNRRIVTRAQAVRMQKQGKLPDYHIVKVKGKEYLRDNPDTKISDNIDHQKLI